MGIVTVGVKDDQFSRLAGGYRQRAEICEVRLGSCVTSIAGPNGAA